MIKCFYKICSIVSRYATYLGIDGLTHIIVMAIVSKLVLFVVPVWLMLLLILAVAVSKELLDRFTGQGCAEWKDLVCDIIGILIALI